MSLNLGHKAIMDKAAQRRDTLIKLEELFEQLPEKLAQVEALLDFMKSLDATTKTILSDSELARVIPLIIVDELKRSRVYDFINAYDYNFNSSRAGLRVLNAKVALAKDQTTT